MALTVGVGTVMDAREVVIIITGNLLFIVFVFIHVFCFIQFFYSFFFFLKFKGTHKSYALYKAVEEGVNHMWTVSAIQVCLKKKHTHTHTNKQTH